MRSGREIRASNEHPERSTERLPGWVILSGLPTLSLNLKRARTYAERMFSHLVVGNLERGDAWDALGIPLATSGRRFAQGDRRRSPGPWPDGIFRLGRRHGEARLEAACARALAAGALSYRSVDSILKGGLEHTALPEPPPVRATRTHANVRGPAAYE